MKKTYAMKCYAGNDPRIDVTSDFIKRNKLQLKRTQDEIVAQIAREQDSFSFGSEVWIDYLDYEHAKPFLTVEAVERFKKQKWIQIEDVYEATQDFLDYMVFAWMKATDQRGLSAGRSIDKLSAWLWLLGREDLANILNDDDLYNPYGTPALIKVCRKMAIHVPQYVINFSKLTV